ncbi:hypothetical protein [Blastomonas sp. UPD001]|uniref:hypothetical protein n=1 Tax=Blastomonas sp. UPD001 TaxID=2217673 RepID=UPI000E34E4BD|nr:hypothetical protein [Blastomonas sp. UPD001]
MNPVSFLQNARAGALRIATLALGAASLSACAYGYGDYGGYGSPASRRRRAPSDRHGQNGRSARRR